MSIILFLLLLFSFISFNPSHARSHGVILHKDSSPPPPPHLHFSTKVSLLQYHQHIYTLNLYLFYFTCFIYRLWRMVKNLNGKTEKTGLQ